MQTTSSLEPNFPQHPMVQSATSRGAEVDKESVHSNLAGASGPHRVSAAFAVPNAAGPPTAGSRIQNGEWRPAFSTRRLKTSPQRPRIEAAPGSRRYKQICMNSLLAALAIFAFSSGAAAASPDDFRSIGLEIPSLLLAQGAQKFGAMDFLEFIRLAPRNPHPVPEIRFAIPGGNERRFARWEIDANGIAQIYYDPMMMDHATLPFAKPIIALHEFMGAEGFMDFNYGGSITLWLISDAEFRGALTRDELRELESFVTKSPDTPLQRFAGGSVIGVGSGGDGGAVAIKALSLERSVAEIKRPTSAQNRRNAFAMIVFLISRMSLEVGWAKVARWTAPTDRARAATLLRRTLDDLKKIRPATSLRSIAKRSGLSPSYLCKIMNGAKPCTPMIAPKLARALQMDELQRAELSALVARAPAAPSTSRYVIADFERFGEEETWLAREVAPHRHPEFSDDRRLSGRSEVDRAAPCDLRIRRSRISRAPRRQRPAREKRRRNRQASATKSAVSDGPVASRDS